MALGRNHKIFNIGNASGTIQGLTRVYHDLTLSGDGTLSSLLGVVGDKADEEVNQFVYDNSATINEVNTSYQTNSGNFLTAIPDYYATTGDINDLAQSISENYQVKGDYVERNSMASAIESSTSGKLDASSFASVSSDFLVASSLNGYATESFVEETSGAITSLIPTNYYPDTNPSAFVNEDWVTAQGYITGVDLTPYQPKSGMIDYQTTAGMTAYATTGDVANKLDTTSFSNVSSTFLTAHQIIPSAKWETASDVVQSNSAQWSENTGDEEVNNAVYNNSAKWNEISVYQSNSSTYLTAHQDISNKLDTTAFSEVSGDFLTTAFEISQSAKWEEATNAYEQNSGTYLTAISIPESATWNEVSTTVQTNSADWASHQDLSYISAQVDNKLDSSSFVPSDFYPMTGNPSGFLTAHQDWTDTITAASANAYNEAIAQIPAPFDPTYISGVIDNKLNTTAFSDVSGSFLTAVSIPESADWSETTDVVQTNSGKWNDITAYQNASAGYLTAHQSLDGYATENWVTAQGYITGVNIPESATWNETSTTVQTNSSNWDNVTNKLDTTSFSNVSGTFLTAHQDLSNYYTKSETSGADELANAFANIPAGDSEVNSYVHDTSATINEVNSTVQSNSATWGQGASTSGLVSGTNVVKKPDYEGSTDGRYWSACISGDVKVFTGYYANDSYISGSVYSLSAIGNDIDNKLDKNTLEHSKTLRIINNNPYEVFDLAYKRTNFTNGSARRISLYDDYADINFYAGEVVGGSNLYSASITAETTATGRIDSDEGKWNIVDFSNGSAILTTLYPAGISDNNISLNIWGGWGPITNCEATCTVYTSAELAPLAFKDDIPSGGGGVPQSAFDELKQSYDVLSASYATLSSLFATYSGQWLLPNEGV